MSNFKMPVMLVRSPFRRVARLVGYIFMSLFGVAEAFLPSGLLLSNLSLAFMLMFEVSLSLGGLLCVYSQLTYKYWGEVIGILPLMAAMAVYGLQSFAHVDLHHLSRVGFGFACVGLTLILFARWQDVRFIQKLADSLADEPEDLLIDDDEEPGE